MAEEERPECASPEGGSTADGAKNSLVREVKDPPDWLPSGWILEIKTQKNGAYAGRQIKCYYNPSTGSRFYSRKQVFRHLNAGKLLGPSTRQTRSVTSSYIKKTCPPTNQDKSYQNSSSNNALTDYHSNGLPYGWTKEIRFRKYKQGTRKYTFYIDPDGRYAFRSLKDVFRYVETGDVHKCANKPLKRSISEMHTVERELNPPTVAKRSYWRRDATKRCLFSDKTPDSDVKMSTEIKESPQRLSLSPPGHVSATTKTNQQCTEVADSSCITPSVKHLNRGNSEETKIVTELNITSYVSALSVQTSDLEKGSESKSAIKKPSDSVGKKLSDAINETPETSQECSQMKQIVLDDACLSKVYDETRQANVRPVEQVSLVPLQQQNEDLPASEVNMLDETELEPKHEEKSQPMKCRRGRKPGSTRKAIKTPLRASERLAALRANQMANSGLGLQGKSVTVLDQSAQPDLVNRRFYQQKEKPVIDLEQLDKLESYEHVDEESNAEKQVQLGRPSCDTALSPCRSLFGDSWPDPCLEFAFKMLTSDIPVFEDTRNIQQCFDQQLGSTKNSFHSGPAFTSSSQTEQFVQMEPWDRHLCFRDDGRTCSLQNGQQSRKKAS